MSRKATKKSKPHRLFWIGEVNETNLNQVIEQIIDIQTTNPKALIDLWIVSEGGDAAIARAFIDFIRINKVNLVTTAFGDVSSAGVMIFGAGKIRRATKLTTFYFHEPYIERNENNINTSQSRILANSLKMSLDMGIRLHIDLFGLKKGVIKKLIYSDKDWTAKKLLKLGMIHEII